MIDDDKETDKNSIFNTRTKVTKIMQFPKTANNPTKPSNEFWPNNKGAANADASNHRSRDSSAFYPMTGRTNLKKGLFLSISYY